LTIFVDASALVAMAAQEPDALALAACLEGERTRLCSAISCWEAVAALVRSYTFSVPTARAHVKLLLDSLDIRVVPLGAGDYDLACDAYAQFGKGRHSAALNMGDCFAYGCAKANNAALLFKGDDFGKTDIRPARQPPG
jgi:ribonuclease VapC